MTYTKADIRDGKFEAGVVFTFGVWGLAIFSR